MDDDLPDFGDVVGLTRLHGAAVARVRAMDIPEAERRAWIAELRRAWRVAVRDTLPAPAAPECPRERP